MPTTLRDESTQGVRPAFYQYRTYVSPEKILQYRGNEIRLIYLDPLHMACALTFLSRVAQGIRRAGEQVKAPGKLS